MGEPMSIEKAREALEPFARLARALIPSNKDEYTVIGVTVGDLRRAAAALEALSARAVTEGEREACSACKGSGSMADWVGLDMRCVEVACDACNGTGRISRAASTDGWQDKVTEFAAAILHGDDDHKDWLTEAAEAFNAGQPLPPPRGKGTAALPTPSTDPARTGGEHG